MEENRAKMLDCAKIAKAQQKKIAQLIKPSGYYNQKSKKLISFAKYLKKNYSCKIEKMFEKPPAELRKELLSLHGVGEETADSIILYAAGKPVFVVDAYTRRFGGRFFGKPMDGYVETQAFFQENLLLDLEIFQEFLKGIGIICYIYRFGKVFGLRGIFWIIAGNRVAEIDGFNPVATYPYNEYVALPPKDPEKVCQDIEDKFGIAATIIDGNNINVKIIEKSKGLKLDKKLIREILLDNPMGQDDEMTPIILVRRQMQK